MCPIGSAPERPFPLPAAAAATLLGIAAMVGGAVGPAAQLGLGLRGQIAVGTLALAVPAVVALLLRREWWPSVRGDRPVTGRTAGLSLLLGAALWVASAGLMEVQSLVVPPPPEYLDAFRAIHQALAPRGPLDALVSVLVIAVLPGACEELVIRGVLLPALGRVLRGAAVAVLVSALVFAVIHLDAYRFLFTLSLGLVLGAVRLGTRSLWPPVIAHATLNTLTFVIAPFVDDPSQPYTPSPVLGALCLATGVAAAWPLLRALVPAKERPASHER